MYKIDVTEKTGNRSNENLSAWYKEKVKVLAEIIIKRMPLDNHSTGDFINYDTEKEVLAK